jgi:alpha-tubulin suppressor-like RCC1 family protein
MADYKTGIWSLQEIRDNILEGSWGDYVAVDPSEVYRMGCNSEGQLGDNTRVHRSSPVQLPGTQWKILNNLSGVKCDGTLWSWGTTCQGLIGTNVAPDGTIYSSPVQIPGTSWCDVRKNFNSCAALALKCDGTLWSWGVSHYGQLGNNVTTQNINGKSPTLNNRSSPMQIIGTQWCAISKGSIYTSAAIKTDGTLWMWGYNNDGQLGQNNTILYSSPVQIPGTQWCCVNSGYNHTYALKTDGTLWAWGCGGSGELGASIAYSSSSPVQIPGNQWNGVVAATILGVGLASKNDGTLWAWGASNCYLTAPATSGNSSSPIQIPGTQWTNNIAMGCLTAAALKTDGTLWVWGSGINGELGTNEVNYYLSPTALGSFWTSIDRGSNNPIWIRSAVNCYNPACEPVSTYEGCGQLWVWGTNCTGGFGLGNYLGPTVSGGLGSCQECTAPFPIKGASGVWKCISTFAQYQYAATAGIKSDNTLWIWGYNTDGLQGQNDRVHRSLPQQLPGTQWRNVSVGYHILATKTDGTLWSWGYNANGQLGDNTVVYKSSPVQIPGTQWCFVSAERASAAIKTDGTLWMWGRNSDAGQLGNSTRVDQSSPIQIPGTQWCKVCATVYRTVALKTDGTLWAWGANGGALGNNSTTNISSPVQIPGTQWCGISASNSQTLALKTDNTLWAWGKNQYGAIGQNNTTQYSSPVQIPGTQWCAIRVGQDYALAIKRDGTLFSWGTNCLCDVQLNTRNGGRLGNYGILGNGGVINRSSPVQIPGTQWKEFATGTNTDFRDATAVFAIKGTTPF